jgi:hypothetical protein
MYFHWFNIQYNKYSFATMSTLLNNLNEKQFKSIVIKIVYLFWEFLVRFMLASSAGHLPMLTTFSEPNIAVEWLALLSYSGGPGFKFWPRDRLF